MTDRFPDDWSDSELQMKRLRDWLINYEGVYPQSPKQTVDMFTERYLQLSHTARRGPHWFYIHPGAYAKLKLKDTPAVAMTDTD